MEAVILVQNKGVDILNSANTFEKGMNLNILPKAIGKWDRPSSLNFSDYCLHIYCYFHNVSADMPSDLLQVFVDLGNLHRTSFIESTGVACSDPVSHNRVQVLSILVLLLACSQDWTCKL